MALVVALLIGLIWPVVGPSLPAQAEPGCVNGGVYVVFARGSGEKIGDTSANVFFGAMSRKMGSLGVSHAWAELGNLDGHPGQDNDANGPNEYPAKRVFWAALEYSSSVRIGTDELVQHLNQRYGNGPGDRNCANETVILGGYSQGADVVGWAIERTGGGNGWSLSATARNHIGAVALYGDPKYLGNYGSAVGCVQPPYAMVAETPCPAYPNVGLLGARNPYVPNDIWSRVSSYCDQSDGVCHGSLALAAYGTHTTAYQGSNGWMERSADRVVGIALSKRNQLNPASGSVLGAFYPSPSGSSAVTGAGQTSGATPTYDNIIRIGGTNGLGVSLRAAPHMSAARVGGLPEGSVVHPACYTRAQNVGGTSLWWKVGSGYYSSFYDTVPLEWQQSLEQHYGVSNCSGVPSANPVITKNRRDLMWYDGTTLWGFKAPGLGTVVSSLGFAPPDWAGTGDYNHDGREDLFWYHGGTDKSIYVIFGPEFTYAARARGPGVGAPVWASTGDFDGNGFRDDIAWYDGYGLFLFQGSGLGTTWETVGYAPPDWAGVGDINQDGKDDLFWYHGGGNGTIYGLTSTGSSFNGAYAIRGPGVGAPQWAGVGDFDGNGKRNDLAWYSGGVLFQFTGPGLGTTGVTFGYAMHDWAGVGKCDDSGRDTLFWYHGQGNGTIYCIQDDGQRFTGAFAIRGPGVGAPTWASSGDFL